MIANIETRKVELIAFIAKLQQEEAICAFEKIAQQYKFYTENETELQKVSESTVSYFKRPIRNTISIEDIVNEQNWQPIDEDKMDNISKKIAIKEPIDVLMAQLTP
jgi:hypothetical protein